MPTFIGLSNFDEIGTPRGNRQISTKKIHQEIIRKSGKKQPKVLYIPTAGHDREDFIKFFQNYYKDLGCKTVDVLRLTKGRLTENEIHDKIFSADVIYVNGGNTYYMLEVWKRLGVDRMLQRAWRQGIAMAGHSAGLSCWFSYICSDSFYRHKPFELKALGAIPAVICPHYDGQPFRQPVLKEILKNKPLVGIALEDGAALEIIDGNYRILKSAPAAKVRRVFWKDGQYVIEEIKASKTFKNLASLITMP